MNIPLLNESLKGKNMRRIYYLIILLIIPIYSCEDIINSEENIKKENILYDHVLQDQENDVIMPLKVGNQWIYKYSILTPKTWYNDYVVRCDTTIYYDTVKIYQRIPFNNEEWFFVTSRYSPLFENGLIVNTDAGLVEFLSALRDYAHYPEIDTMILRAKYPCDKYREFSWNDIYWIGSWDSGQNAVRYNHIETSFFDSIDVAAGSFECYRYEYSSLWSYTYDLRSPSRIEWFCPNTGLVKFVERYSTAHDKDGNAFPIGYRDTSGNIINRKICELVSYQLD